MYKIDWKMPFPLSTILLGAVVLAGIAFTGGFFVANTQYVNTIALASESQPANVDFSPVWKAWSVMDEKFVPAAIATSTRVATSTEESNQKRIWGMISGLAASLDDPYTYFLPPVENEEFVSDMSGAFEGIGMEIAVRDHVLTVVSPLKGTPADRAGIKAQDLVLKIDGFSTTGMDVSSAVKKIRGPKGTEVTLTIGRSGWPAPKEIKVTRDVINVPTVIATPRPDGIFVIQLLTFTANSPDLFRNALREFIESHDSKLVLDLRGNPGGYLEAAVDIASWFLPSGKVVVTEDYSGHTSNVVHRSLGRDIFNENLKMVILVDRGSASASEILADALRFHGKGKIVGTNTFGKGSVQELVEITSKTALKITVARWLGPDGIQIPREGITPDVKIEPTEEQIKAGKDIQLDKAVEILNEK
jgi:carboxyl-terminal processing protease